jgi:hypothetical protein
VEFITDGGNTILQLVGPDGLILENLLEQRYDRPKTIRIDVDLTPYKPGMYYLRFQNGSKQQMKALMKN